MAYSKIRDDSASDADHGKDEFLPWARRDEPRILFYRNLFAVALALWIATLTTLVWTLLSRDEPFRSHVATSLLFPSVPSRVVMFDPDPRFHFTAFDTGSSAWIDLMPKDGGIVSVDRPQKYHLPKSYRNRTNPHAEVYSMSMYHQLHCLDAIRIRLGTLEGFINVTEAAAHQQKRMVFGAESHVDHCIDYLRQAIMCAGDLSLEHSLVPDEFGFNGWGTAHQCADWSSMGEIAVAWRYNRSSADFPGRTVDEG